MEAPRIQATEAGMAIVGTLDHRTVPGLITQMPAPGADAFEIDLRETGKVDSAGLAMLIDWGNRHLQAEQKIRLRGASLKVRQLIAIMHLDGFFELLA